MKSTSAIALLLAGVILSLLLASGSVSSAKMVDGPFNLVAADTGRYVQLNWDPAIGTPVRGYNIYRSNKVPDNWEKLNEGEFTSTSFVDFSAPRPELTFYRINSIGESGEEIPSASVVGISTIELVGQRELATAYNKNNIITDAQLTNAGAMNAAQIQSFLDSQGSVLANYSSGGKSAAQRIYDECQIHGISPYVVLVTLQKEKGLIKSSTANPNSFAMGWNTGDSSTSDFASQIYYGTRQFRIYYTELENSGWRTGQFANVGDGTITAENSATEVLNVYTPWIGEGGGGQTGVGGNYMFWDLWYNTFWPPSESSKVPNFVQGLSLNWPVVIDDRGQLGNDYAQYNYVSSNKYHTGLDLGVASGTTVRAASNGHVVKIQENDVGCNPDIGGACEDHGYGTSIIVRHLASGATVYTQYSHMNSVAANILSACGPVDPGRRKRHTCTNPVAVSAGTTLGSSGASCYGYNCTSPHLHFEVKTFGTLGTGGDDAGQFGYTVAHPDQSGYRDPIVNIHSTIGISPAVRVRVLSTGNLRVGPGGSGSTAYRTIRTLSTGEEYDAIRSSSSTNTPSCPSGWYQIRPTNGSLFNDTTRGGQIPEGWFCADLVSGGVQCPAAVGQGTSAIELTAFQNAFNVSGGQSVLGCATASVRFDGFTSFAGTIGHYQTFANGDIEYLTNGSRAGQAYAVLTPFENKWASFGFNSNNPLGYPIGVTSQSANSCYGTQNRYQSFEGGSLNQHLSGAKNGQVFEVHGAIHRRWEMGGFAICPLGMPISDETTAQSSGASGSSGRLSQFEGGQIYWKTNASAAYEVHGAIYSKYVALGGSASWLGFPTSNEYVSNGRARSDFEAGYITTLDGVNYQAFAYACPGPVSANPANGSVGSTVTITGNNFSGVSSVKFTNNASAPFTINSNTQISTTVPTGATNGPITIVKTGCANTQTNSFTVASPPISITVTSSPSGRTFSVDGVSYTSSQTFTWQAGSSHSISTTSSQGNSQTRYNWTSWSDGGAISHSVAPTSNTTYTASFATQHYLTMIAGTGGTVNPPSNWFNSGQNVTISASPATGFTFSSWVGIGSGSFNGSINPASLTMNGPITMTANFTVIPTRTLMVTSSNPGSGVNISVSPNDNNGPGNGTTQFSRTYSNNASVNLSAPATASGNNFLKWQRDGSDWTTNQTTSVTMDSNHTMTAVYVTPPAVTVQFANTGYTVGEGGSSGTVTVVRLGNTSGAATVNYTTSDGAGLNNCATINGAASSRCDYAASLGTVSFAPGENTKTLSIPIVDDSYAEPSESFSIRLSSPTGSNLGPQATAVMTISDNEVSVGPNPIVQTSFFVRQHYIDFLGREPDPGGFAAWQNVINNCPVGAADCDRIHVSSGFFRSPEFQGRGYFVYRFYPVALGRKPDYVEFVPDLAKVSGFLSESELEAARVAFIAEFMSRPAFVTKYNGLNDTEYVDTLLATAQVTSPNRNFWIAALGGGTRTRAQVLREIAESTEVYNKYYNQAFVVMQYFGYLRRDPDASYLNWIQVLDSTGNSRNMINGFVNSLEYRFRFGP